MAITFSEDRSEPKNNVTLTVTADGGSKVNVLAVDKSVNLLRTGNDITPDRVSVEKYFVPILN